MKPDWKDSPEWANWVAMDDDGEWYWHEKDPILDMGSFNSKGRWEYCDANDIFEPEKEPRP